MELKDLNLTENDFSLIIEGLDALPEKGAVTKIVSEMMVGVLARNKEHAEKLMLDMQRKESGREQARSLLMEDVRILQGKLLQLKRYLQQEGALKAAEDIINKR